MADIKKGDTVVVKMCINQTRKATFPKDNFRWNDFIHREFYVKHVEHGYAVLDTDELIYSECGRSNARLNSMLVPIVSLSKVIR